MKKSDIIKLIALLTGALALLKGSIAWATPKKAKQFERIFTETERKYSIPEKLLLRMAQQESHFRDDIIYGPYQSSAGAQGIMQIIPRWHPDVNPWKPSEAIPYAGKYLRKLYDRFGNWSDAIAAYNWGPTNLSRYKKGEISSMPSETRNYIAQVGRDIPLT